MLGQSAVNIILFLTVLVAATILTLWYISSVQPTRYVIGAVSDDLQHISQHLANACAASIYNATYKFSTTSGFFIVNASSFCISTDIFGSCKDVLYSCDIIPMRIDLRENTILRIDKDKNVTLHT